jgi:methylenetetrahydrofolate dehydrogenase (NADP+)/methenyltetrahydrofolate cyclohydrolase
MSATIIDGKAVARAVRKRVAREVAQLEQPPGLATVLVGDDPASAVYVGSKRKQCVAAGMRDLHQQLPGHISQRKLAEVIGQLSADPQVNGILLQLPLPDHLDAAPLTARIDSNKDVDGLTTLSAGRLAQGATGLRPCTPSGVIELLDAYQVPIEGAEAVIVGRSELVGKPQAQLLLQRNATVTIGHSRTRDLPTMCRRADILIAAAGVPGIIIADMVKPGATVIDVGIHRTDDGLRGDVDFAGVREIAGTITPVPGGVGPMTIAMLLQNTVTAAAAQQAHQAKHRRTT